MTLVSRPRSVPRQVILTSGSIRRSASASAMAGSMWPPDPPPAITTLRTWTPHTGRLGRCAPDVRGRERPAAPGGAGPRLPADCRCAGATASSGGLLRPSRPPFTDRVPRSAILDAASRRVWSEPADSGPALPRHFDAGARPGPADDPPALA